MQEIKFQNLILEKILEISPWLGWNNKSAEKACTDLGLDKNYYLIYYPQGIQEILIHYNKIVIDNMIIELNKSNKINLNTREKIYLAVKIILDQNIKNKLAIKRVLSYYIIPNRSVFGLNNLYKITDEIWYNIGDKSTDFNYYTKRFILTKMLFSTILFWTNDRSKDNSNSLEYLNRKLEQVVKSSPKKIFKSIFNISNFPFIRLIKK